LYIHEKSLLLYVHPFRSHSLLACQLHAEMISFCAIFFLLLILCDFDIEGNSLVLCCHGLEIACVISFYYYMAV
jgi:hypothetical protein